MNSVHVGKLYGYWVCIDDTRIYCMEHGLTLFSIDSVFSEQFELIDRVWRVNIDFVKTMETKGHWRRSAKRLERRIGDVQLYIYAADYVYGLLARSDN